MFIKVVDIDTNVISLVNVSHITHINCPDEGGYRVWLTTNTYLVIGDADFQRLCSSVGYVLGNGSEPAKPGKNETTLVALIALSDVLGEIDTLAKIPDPHYRKLIQSKIKTAQDIMSDWQKAGNFQVPPHDQNPTQYIPDAFGGLGANADPDEYPDPEDEF